MFPVYIIRFSLYALLAMMLSACSESADRAYLPTPSPTKIHHAQEHIIGIHPLHNPQRTLELYGPLVDQLNAAMPAAHFQLETSRSYAEFEKKLYAGHFAFAMPNPYQALLSLKHGYRVFGKMGDDEAFRGIILIRRDSGIHKVSDLKGKIVAYPAPTALAGAMMPQYYLQTHGIDINRDIENRYVGSQESSIEMVFRGHVAAGATWVVPWNRFISEHPEKANQLEVKWQTDTLPNNAWVVRQDIPAPLAQQFAQQLFSLQDNASGKTILARLRISHFAAANDETYRPVHVFLEAFSKTVREVER